MRIAIVAAMDSELKELISSMDHTKINRHSGFSFYEGTLAERNVVLLLSGIGKVNAAVGTTLLIQKYSPDMLINTGVAGGFHPDFNPGDMLISKTVCHHDVDISSLDYKIGQLPDMPLMFTADEKLLELATFLASENPNFCARIGLVVSGDLFIQKEEDIQRIIKNFPDALAGEMEAAAIAQTCHLFQIPWIILRSISDRIGSQKNAMEYSKFVHMAAKRSVQFVIKMLKLTGEK